MVGSVHPKSPGSLDLSVVGCTLKVAAPGTGPGADLAGGGARVPTVETLSADELRRRREVVLEQAGMPEDVLRDRADQYLLTPDLAALVIELDEIDFLLGA